MLGGRSTIQSCVLRDIESVCGSNRPKPRDKNAKSGILTHNEAVKSQQLYREAAPLLSGIRTDLMPAEGVPGQHRLMARPLPQQDPDTGAGPSHQDSAPGERQVQPGLCQSGEESPGPGQQHGGAAPHRQDGL